MHLEGVLQAESGQTSGLKSMSSSLSGGVGTSAPATGVGTSDSKPNIRNNITTYFYILGSYYASYVSDEVIGNNDEVTILDL